jgi:hypothetical protein
VLHRVCLVHQVNEDLTRIRGADTSLESLRLSSRIDSDSSATGSQPRTGSSDKPLPGPVTNKPMTPLRQAS